MSESRNVREIMATIAERHGITVDEMIGPYRARRYSWPRHEAMSEAYVQTKLSTTALGRYFKRHHTTVIAGHEAHLNRTWGRSCD